MSLRSPNLNIMMKAAQKASRGLLRDFGEVEQLQVSRKGPGDFVTKSDKTAEKIITEMLHEARPDYGILSEESREYVGKDTGNRWIVDPLDGTTNFIHGLPFWCISIAHESDGEIVSGLVYDPLRDEAFMAEKGKGAFVNQRRLRVSGRKDLSETMIGIGLAGTRGSAEGQKQAATHIAALMRENCCLRRLGAGALDLAYVAAARQDGFFEVGLRDWDMAAGLLIVREAGGIVTQLASREDPMGSGTILAANSAIHGKLAKLLAGR